MENARTCQKTDAAIALSAEIPKGSKASTKHNWIVPKKPGLLGSIMPAAV